MKRVGRLAVVEESSDVDMACEPPRASVPGQSFPAAFRRNLVTKKDETAAASAVAASPLEASPGRVKDEAAADAERMFASMSEQDILKAQEEIRQLASSKTVELLQRRAARRLAGGTNLEPPVVAGLPDAEVQPSRPLVMDRELMLPPIEHEKLAWTDPESKQAPREKEPDFAHSVRVQSFRFGLKGEIMDPNAASEETYNAGLHHHGEEPEKAGYTLEELLTLMRSQNEPQNLFAAQILLHIAEGVLRGDFANELLYPEAGPRSMTIGEGILWEVLSMNMLVPIRLCCFKRSLALRDACLQLISALVAALADDSELTQHAAESHWGVIVFPSAPLFEDDGSEEMEKLDGLRCMVRQLDFLPLLDAGTAAGLNCLCKVAGHSRSLGLLLLSRSELVDVAASKGLQEAPALAMRLFRLLLSCDARHTRTLEEKQVTSACWRHFLASADQSLEQIEAALLLRVLLLFGSQTNVLVDTLSELLTRVVGKKMRPWLPCLLCDALLVSGAGANVEKLMEALLHGSVGNCVLEGDASAVLHLAATLSKRCGVEIRPVVAPLLAKLEKGGHSVWLAAMRLANSSPNVLKELPSWLWNSERVKLVAKTLSPPQPQADKVNRFQTQRRLRTLVRDRERILLVREMLIAGHGVLDDPIALFGMAFDLVSRLAIVGADEWLLLELLERVLLNPLFLERVAKQVMQKEYEESESLRQSKMLCSALLGGVRSAWFPDEAWLNRCRSVCGESEAGSPRPDGLVAGESLCMASFVGADWLFSLCKSENGDTVRAAMQMLLLAELVRSCQSLAIMSNTSKLIKLSGLFSSPSRPFLHPPVASALQQLLAWYSNSIDGSSFGDGLGADDQFNPMQAATDLVENFVASGHNSPVFAAFVFFFMRADLPHDFRMLLWSALAPAWRLLRLDKVVVAANLKLHLEPAESSKRVLTLMEEALRLGHLTPAKNRLVFWIAVHHVAAWAFGAEEEWLRAQLLKRLKHSCPAVLALVAAYSYRPEQAFPPPTDEPDTIPPERRALLETL